MQRGPRRQGGPARGANLAESKEEARRRGKYLGMGISTYIEVCGVAPSKWIGAAGEGWGAAMWESANIRVHLTGNVVAPVGTQPQGQGHETTYAQAVADKLGVPMDDVIVQTVTPSPVNPLGVKGVGEVDTIASTAAVANAVNDALAPFGIRHLDMPLSAARIWAAMQAAGKSAIGSSPSNGSSRSNGKEAQA